MISSSSPANSNAVLVLDASVVINLNATACAAEIIKALPHQFVITDIAIAELAMGSHNGHDDARRLQVLIDAGLIDSVELSDGSVLVYQSLVEGSALGTLDDGEAATIAYADEIGAIAVIDERKARKICNKIFSHLSVLSTVDLLLHDSIASSFGLQRQADAVFNALTVARMRVPPEQIERAIKLIGKERASTCCSFPKSLRVGTD